MIFNMTGGGSGGAALNFEVVGGTTQPVSPKENTIWVNTDQEITSWIFSATEPETPEEGMVWIFNGTSSIVEFNALKMNGIQVYPISAKQYVGGALVDKTAKSYQGGEWVEWIFDITILSPTVDETGGWNWYESGSPASATKNSDGSWSLYRTTGPGYLFRTKNVWDLTGYSILRVSLSNAVEDAIGVVTASTASVSNALAQMLVTGSGTYDVDISAFNGLHAVAINKNYNGSGHSVKITEIKLIV